jgi:hypothetical protein
MRFLPDGPDIPDELITLQEEGQVIFICGAGVSMTVGLKSFRGLVEKIYQELGEDWEIHPAEREVMREDGRLAYQYDRMLRSLEKRLAASNLPRNRGMRERMRNAIRNALTPPDQANLENHLVLLELSRDEEGQSRILTTNFDTLFERSWFKVRQVPIPSHAGAAMPQPNVAGYSGVLHLHGRLRDAQPGLDLTETDLVLTSAEFGDAYLRTGWASRYIYDVVRAHTVVLVGYAADDPPMRYLLEVLEADRERYPDLHQVYAFAECADGSQELMKALWRAKGVEPILYRPTGLDHSSLYNSIKEWGNYAKDPTAWRKEQLRCLMATTPKNHAPEALIRVAALLSHGDAALLVGELAPSPEWVCPLQERRVFNRVHAHAGLWIAARLNDADMIRAAVLLPQFDDRAVWYVERALEQKRDELPSVRLKAWQLILKSKTPKINPYDNYEWLAAVRYIRKGEAGHNERQLVRRLLQPRMVVERVWHTPEEKISDEEYLHDLLRVDFRSVGSPTPAEILEAWPQDVALEKALFSVLERALTEALEEASDAGFLNGWDGASSDVPSVADHPQNTYRSGFYPIVRVLADLWTRIASKDKILARNAVAGWQHSPFLLIRRVFLFAACSETTYSAKEAAKAVLELDDKTFWIGSAPVEVMRLMVNRWDYFDRVDRETFESRVREGIPRKLFPDNVFEEEEKWVSVRDNAIMRRLARLQSAGKALGPESEAMLRGLRSEHPQWTPGGGDRDDFSVWHESHNGPDGEPNLLSGVSDHLLVQEAMRLQREQQFEQGDVWRLLCAADPRRALHGLELETKADHWDANAWRDLIWATIQNQDETFQVTLAGMLLKMPKSILAEIISPACSWLQQNRKLLTNATPKIEHFSVRSYFADFVGRLLNRSLPKERYLAVWDRLADVVYAANLELDTVAEDHLFEHALGQPAYILAQSLLERIASSNPLQGTGIPLELRKRLTRIVYSVGDPGLFARLRLCQSLSYLEWLDHEWAFSHLLPSLDWSRTHALAMWQARAQDRVGTTDLFNTLKKSMIIAFEQPAMTDNSLEALLGQLLWIAIAHRRGESQEYAVSNADIKRALSTGPDILRVHCAWQLWSSMSQLGENATERAERWQRTVGPLFEAIWPLDAALRSEAASRNLVLMALECGDAFPEAVDAVVDLIIPYQLYMVTHEFRLEAAHEGVIRKYPKHALRLLNALIDHRLHPVPGDLTEFLQACLDADASVVSEVSYVRLFGLRRLRAS